MDYKKLYLQKKKEYIKNKNKNIITGGGKNKSKSSEKKKTKQEGIDLQKIEDKMRQLTHIHDDLEHFLKTFKLKLYDEKKDEFDETIKDYETNFDSILEKYTDLKTKLKTQSENIQIKERINEIEIFIEKIIKVFRNMVNFPIDFIVLFDKEQKQENENENKPELLNTDVKMPAQESSYEAISISDFMKHLTNIREKIQTAAELIIKDDYISRMKDDDFKKLIEIRQVLLQNQETYQEKIKLLQKQNIQELKKKIEEKFQKKYTDQEQINQNVTIIIQNIEDVRTKSLEQVNGLIRQILNKIELSFIKEELDAIKINILKEDDEVAKQLLIDDLQKILDMIYQLDIAKQRENESQYESTIREQNLKLINIPLLLNEIHQTSSNEYNFTEKSFDTLLEDFYSNYDSEQSTNNVNEIIKRLYGNIQDIIDSEKIYDKYDQEEAIKQFIIHSYSHNLSKELMINILNHINILINTNTIDENNKNKIKVYLTEILSLFNFNNSFLQIPSYYIITQNFNMNFIDKFIINLTLDNIDSLNQEIQEETFDIKYEFIRGLFYNRGKPIKNTLITSEDKEHIKKYKHYNNIIDLINNFDFKNLEDVSQLDTAFKNFNNYLKEQIKFEEEKKRDSSEEDIDILYRETMGKTLIYYEQKQQELQKKELQLQQEQQELQQQEQQQPQQLQQQQLQQQQLHQQQLQQQQQLLQQQQLKEETEVSESKENLKRDILKFLSGDFKEDSMKIIIINLIDTYLIYIEIYKDGPKNFRSLIETTKIELETTETELLKHTTIKDTLDVLKDTIPFIIHLFEYLKVNSFKTFFVTNKKDTYLTSNNS